MCQGPKWWNFLGLNSSWYKTKEVFSVNVMFRYVQWLWGVNKIFFFRVKPAVLWLSPFRFIESDLLYFAFPFLSRTVLVLTQSFSFFLSQIFSISTQSFLFFESVLLVFLSRTFSILTQYFPFIDSFRLIFFTAPFPLLPVLGSDLIAICTVDKIKDGGVHGYCTTMNEKLE